MTARPWVWLALVDGAPAGATACAAVADARTGAPTGFLALWAQGRKPVRHARRADARILDPRGEAAQVSLVLPPDGVRLPFDDLAVQQARRALLAGAPFDAVSTLLRDASHFEGSVIVARGDQARRSDPFARIFPARRLHVRAGVIGRVPAPAGPVIERYGSERPWPWDVYG